jgi:O-antigen ligase
LRIGLWEIGLDAFRQAPFFGHGMSASRTIAEQGFKDRFGTKGLSHFHNGFLTASVQAGLAGAAALAAIFLVALWNATAVLRSSDDPTQRFGATVIVLTVIIYLVGGMAGMLIGHDILDSTLMIFLISGTYLACGRRILPLQ